MSDLRVLHSADWQIGRPFAMISDPDRRSRLQQARLSVIDRIGAEAESFQADLIVVAGDLFDSPSLPISVVSEACQRIGKIGRLVVAIPGNHDFGGVGSLWTSSEFLRERDQFAPNLRLLDRREPFENDRFVIFPCPLLRRHETDSPTRWLHGAEWPADDPRPRLVIAHGSTIDFGGLDEGERIANLLDLATIDPAKFDYVALGDWHGTVRIDDRTWYSGTPEPDRFPRSADYAAGGVLRVIARRGAAPSVERVATGSMRWTRLAATFGDLLTVDDFSRSLLQLIGNQGHELLVEVSLQGVLGIDGNTALLELIETMRHRVFELRIENRVQVAPTEFELAELTTSPDDPLIARVASRLVSLTTDSSPEARIARRALCELHLLVKADHRSAAAT